MAKDGFVRTCRTAHQTNGIIVAIYTGLTQSAIKSAGRKSLYDFSAPRTLFTGLDYLSKSLPFM